MVVYIAKRILSAMSVVLVTLIASFALFFLVPSSPGLTICGAKCPPSRLAQINHTLGLDKPKSDQLLHYLRGLFIGYDVNDGEVVTHCSAPCLGYSYAFTAPVTTLVGNALPVTATIVIGAAFIFLPLGVLTGVLAGRYRGSPIDRGIVVVTQGMSAIPFFIVALIVFLYFTFLPPAEYTTGQWEADPLAWAAGFTAAWFTLGIFNSSVYTRYVRATMIESLSEDYVRTARAKGISGRKVLWKHALRATLTPLATIFGLDLATQLAGSIFIENVFNLPGLGFLTLRAFGQYDLPVLMGTVLVASIALVIANLLVDIAYTYLDPRVRLT